MKTLNIEGPENHQGDTIEDIRDLDDDTARELLRGLWQVAPAAARPAEQEFERAYHFATRAARNIAWQFRPGPEAGQVWLCAPLEDGKDTAILLRQPDLSDERSFLLTIMPLLSVARRESLPPFDPALN